MLVIAAVAWRLFRRVPPESRGPHQGWIIGGLLVSAVSDVAIEFSTVLGGSLFLLAVLLYATAFLRFPAGRRLSRRLALTIAVSAAALALFQGFAALVVLPRADAEMAGLHQLFLVYMLILSFALGAAVSGPASAAFIVAMALFYVSDLVVHYGSLLGFTPELTILNGLFYYAAQILLAQGLPGRRAPIKPPSAGNP
jgi:hypothetical protein